ncbi:DMT family transporter [Thermodesulfobacteriota bacterium]
MILVFLIGFLLFILLASITYSAFFILHKPLLKRYSPLEVTSYAIWIATVLMLPFGISVFKAILLVSIYSTIAAIYIGIFPTVIAFLCWSAALSKIEVSKASIFLYIIPVITIVIGYIWLHELPPLKSFFGGIIAIIGVIIANMKSANTEPPHALDSQGWRPALK